MRPARPDAPDCGHGCEYQWTTRHGWKLAVDIDCGAHDAPRVLVPPPHVRYYAQPVMAPPVINPRLAYALWMRMFIPEQYWPALELRLDAIQQQAVHMTALKLRESGMGDVADLIDPGNRT